MFNYYPQVNEWYNFNYDLTLVYMKNRTVQQLWIFLWSQALTHLEVRHRLGGIFIYTWSPLLFSSPYLTPFLASKPAGATCPKSQQKAALNFSYLPNLLAYEGGGKRSDWERGWDENKIKENRMLLWPHFISREDYSSAPHLLSSTHPFPCQQTCTGIIRGLREGVRRNLGPDKRN